MKTFASKEKRSAPAVRKTRPYVHHPMGPVQQAQRVEIRRILRSTGAQAKLTIGQPNDKYEQEADRVADRVMRMSNADVAQRVETGRIRPMQIQHMCPECEEEQALQRQPIEEEEEELQAKFADEHMQRQPIEEEDEEMQAKEIPGQTPQIGSGVESRINSLKGGGQPLDPAARSFFEPRFGHNFSNVRIHADSNAADTAKSINARAFTLGNHVVMGLGVYQPKSQLGQRLLGHELTHVIQQGEGRTSSKAKKQESIESDPIDAQPNANSPGVVMRDFAVALPNPDAIPIELSAEDILVAIEYNTRRFSREIEIEQLRDVLGISSNPAVIDEAFVRALLRYQAQENLTQDGKLGPITASRLSEEFRTEAAFLGRDAGRELRREARRLDRRSFTITVTSAATELTNRGSAEYAAQWGVPDPQANGWIIQHVTWDAEKEDAAGTVLATNNSDTLDFWEGWEVKNGNVFIGSSADAHVADTFRTIDEGAGTKGTVTITGRVTFMPGFNLQIPPWGHTVPEARALPTITARPAGWADGFARLHRMIVTWNDTIATPTHGVTTTP